MQKTVQITKEIDMAEDGVFVSVKLNIDTNRREQLRFVSTTCEILWAQVDGDELKNHIKNNEFDKIANMGGAWFLDKVNFPIN
jgi:hypothetical protein